MHAEAQDLAADLLAACDRASPGAVQALYVTGSAALDDFTPGRSDLDFVAVTKGEIDGGAIALGARAKRYDGVFLSWEDLTAGPDGLDGPRLIFEVGRARLAPGGGQRNPVTWKTLRQCGVAARGPRAEALNLWQDDARLAAWTRDNLNTYWRGLARRSAAVLSLSGAYSLSGAFASWSVLGPARMLHTLETGAIVSKSGAGQWARTALDERWTRVLDEALRVRAGEAASGYKSAFARRRDVLAFMHMAIERGLA